MKNDPDAESSAVDEANAAKVDTITNLQKAQYLSQADSMYLHETTKSPVKKLPEAGNEDEVRKQFEGASDSNVNFVKIPAGVYGHKDLQKGLYMLLRSMAKADYSATISGVSSTSAECSRSTFFLDVRMPLSAHSGTHQPTSSSPTWSVRHSPGSPWQMQSRSRSTAMSPLFSRCPILKSSLSGPQRSTAPCPRIRSQLLRQTGTASSTGRLACISNR